MTNNELLWHLLLCSDLIFRFLSEADIGRLASVSSHHLNILHHFREIYLSGSEVRSGSILSFLEALCRGRYPHLQKLYVTAASTCFVDQVFRTAEYRLHKSGSLLIRSLHTCQKLA